MAHDDGFTFYSVSFHASSLQFLRCNVEWDWIRSYGPCSERFPIKLYKLPRIQGEASIKR